MKPLPPSYDTGAENGAVRPPENNMFLKRPMVR